MGTVVDLKEEVAAVLTSANFLNKETKEKLLGYIEEIERQEDAKRDVCETIAGMYAEAKSEGFDTKTMRQVIRLRRKDAAERNDELSILEVYMHALGM
jgi:uncharacterized protein (UPF0335 family)